MKIALSRVIGFFAYYFYIFESIKTKPSGSLIVLNFPQDISNTVTANESIPLYSKGLPLN